MCEKCGAHFIDKYVQESNDQSLCLNQLPPVNSSQNLLQETSILNKLNINSTVVTPIKVEKFVHWLQGYNEKEKYFLLTGFKFGSNIPYVGKREYRYSMNLKSANENPDILREFFFKEVKAGRVDGPFDVPPFSNLQISPLGLVPKKKIGEYRVIHHLSYPDQLSVIDGIPQDMCTVQYQTIDDAVSLLTFHGKGSLMSKTDLENSYRLVSIDEKDHELLWA